MNLTTFKKVNWDVMFNYNVGPDSFVEERNSFLQQLATYILSHKNAGFLKQDKITLNAGLGINIPEQVAIFENGNFAPLLSSIISVPVADATFDRLDRIEVEFQEVDGATGVNETGDTIVINKDISCLVYVNAGTPSASPSVNATTANRLSLGVVKVRAGVNTLLESDLYLDERYFDSAIPDNDLKSYNVENNQSDDQNPINLPIVFDPSVHKAMSVKYYLERKTDLSEVSHIGEINIRHNLNLASTSVKNPFSGDDCNVEFKLDGEFLSYNSDDLVGLNYEGKFEILDIKRVMR